MTKSFSNDVIPSLPPGVKLTMFDNGLAAFPVQSGRVTC